MRTRPPDRPLLAALLIFVGGVFDLAFGFIVAATGFTYYGLGIGPAAGDLAAVGIASLLLGLVLVIVALAFSAVPESHVGVGVLAVVLALITFPLGGGFGVGFALALAGGALAFAWRPASPFYIAPDGWEMCPVCGAALPSDREYCTHCGSELETPPSGRNQYLDDGARYL
ncbi:MAG: zinc ribbon domain-containing protein [Thermoplasmata archaeon]